MINCIATNDSYCEVKIFHAQEKPHKMNYLEGVSDE